jgi:fluoroquinolone transport system permease protein
MNRVLSTLQWDVRVQYRQGVYYAAVFVVVVWVVLLTQLPSVGRDWLLPFALFMDLSVFGIYFMAAILFLEKGEGVLAALVVTPMRKGEYLLSKVLSLTLVALLASILVVVLVQGVEVNWVLLLVGTALNSWLLTLAGFIIAVRYNAINEFLLPSMIVLAPSQLPLLDYFGIWQHWLLYLVPTQPAMLLIEAAFKPVPAWEIAYSLIYLVIATAVVTWWAIRSFESFVVRTDMEG